MWKLIYRVIVVRQRPNFENGLNLIKSIGGKVCDYRGAFYESCYDFEGGVPHIVQSKIAQLLLLLSNIPDEQ